MSTRLAGSAGLIGAATMSSRLLAVGRERVIAYLFGAVRVFTSIAVALGVPVAAARILHIEECKDALARVASRLGMS